MTTTRFLLLSAAIGSLAPAILALAHGWKYRSARKRAQVEERLQSGKSERTDHRFRQWTFGLRPGLPLWVVVFVLAGIALSEAVGNTFAAPAFSRLPRDGSQVGSPTSSLPSQDVSRDLTRFLLTTEDVPKGWNSVRNADFVGALRLEDDDFCGEKVQAPSLEAEAVVVFVHGLGTYLFHGVGKFSSPEGAHGFIENIRSSSTKCASWNSREGRVASSFIIREVSAPLLGDEAVRVVVAPHEEVTAMLPTTSDFVYVRTGALVVSIVSVGLADQRVTDEFVRLALAKVPRL